MLRITAAVLLVALAACGGRSSASPPAPRSSTAGEPEATGCDLSTGTIEVGTADGARSADVEVPEGAPPDDGWPVMVLLHGHGGSAAQIAETSGLGVAAADEGLLAVLPDAEGGPARWNFDHRPDGPDDEAFLAALLDDLAASGCADPARLVLVGSSNGAAFAAVAACHPDLSPAVVAVVMVIATLAPDCPPEVRPSVLSVRGTDDTRVPYDGGGGAVALTGTWADHAGCASHPEQVTGPAPDVERTTWAGCADDATVALDTWLGGTHRWPVAEQPGGYSATPAVVAFAVEALGSRP